MNDLVQNNNQQAIVSTNEAGQADSQKIPTQPLQPILPPPDQNSTLP